MTDDEILARAEEITLRRIGQADSEEVSPQACLMHAALTIGGDAVETLIAYWYDRHAKFIAFDRIAIGGTDSAFFSNYEICRQAVKREATQVVLCHNHPNGNSAPSEADKTSAKKIKAALEIIGIRLVGSCSIAGMTAECAVTGERFEFKKTPKTESKTCCPECGQVVR